MQIKSIKIEFSVFSKKYPFFSIYLNKLSSELSCECFSIGYFNTHINKIEESSKSSVLKCFHIHSQIHKEKFLCYLSKLNELQSTAHSMLKIMNYTKNDNNGNIYVVMKHKKANIKENIDKMKEIDILSMIKGIIAI